MLFDFLSLFENALSSFLYFALHLDMQSAFPKPLSAKEELLYFERYKNGDTKARDKLIEHNLRLVAHIIKKYYQNFSDQDDLISIGTIGLIKAVETFDYTKANRFAAYGSKCIDNEVLMHFRSLKKSALDVHIEAPLDTESDSKHLTLIDTIEDKTNISDEIELSICSQRLYECIKTLDKRERQIICMRYGLYNTTPLTQREVAKKLKISRSYVSRLETKILEKLRGEMDN